MHAVACRSLLLRRAASLRSRQIAGRRFPVRSFRTSRPRGSESENNNDHAASIASSLEPPEPPDGANDAAEQSLLTPISTQDVPPNRNGKGPYGSAKRRMRRNVVQKLENVVPTPPDIINNNVIFWRPVEGDDAMIKEINGGNASDRPDEEVYPNASVGGGSYLINRDVLFEIQASVNAGLKPAWAGEADSLAASKPHLVLQSPRDGGQSFLDEVVKNVAQRCRADVIEVEAQDIAEFIADNDTLDSSPYTTGSLRTLGYDTHVAPFPEKGSKEQFDESADEDGMHEEDFAETQASNKLGRPSPRSSSFITQPMIISSVSGDIGDVLKSLNGFGIKSSSRGNKADDTTATGQDTSKQSGNGLAIRLVDALVNEVTSTRVSWSSNSTSREGESIDSVTPSAEGIVIHVKDYLEIYSTTAGNSLIRQLNDYVLRKRKDGKKVFLLGTTSSEDLLPTNTQEGWKDIQNESSSGPYRTIITPCTSTNVKDLFKRDENSRTEKINIRHLQDMIKRMTSSPELTDAICKPGNMQLQSSSAFASGLSEDVWSFEHVQRLAHTALGLTHADEEMNTDHIEWALNLLQSSDKAKSDWLGEDRKVVTSIDDGSTGSTSANKGLQDEKIAKLRKSCNNHEKRLLNGVVDASKLRTTFEDVRVNAGTVDALRNLTSLSLTRPEAFTYGVLASEKIPGLLLYGPPGTGKTLLAKAVAKESGATILEVSGADIFDMYVGEGEKNVRAIFSLARKVTPCVVFIDEADALFSQRSNNSVRNTHREIVNQFLREWDGMSENSTFIMVATNRPFDLDDAVLRRLPRRILVDLPTDKDREAILKIHLQGEQLAEDVNIEKLAQKTPYYSGSDLKNVCVAAALAAVREETEAVTKKSPSSEAEDTSSDTETSTTQQAPEVAAAPKVESSEVQYPKIRTLRNDHFDKALEEISASISEDMSTLNAIRRFDEKYGDRKGRKKRSGGYGFGLVPEKERARLEDGRIRTR